MDLPPSGWYPDPYGAPELLRWWDGATWTDHTYAEPKPAPAAEPATSPEPNASRPSAHPAADATRIDPGTRLAVAETRADPGAQLAVIGPPTGPRTVPQPAIPDGYGWQGTDDRRRKILIAAGLTGGVAAACAVVALVVTSMNASPRPPSADPVVPAKKTAPAAAQPPQPSQSASATASPSPSSTVMSTVTDATSGLTYGQLPAPWAPGCPATLNGLVFTWAAGESAVAGQVNGGQTTWYGAACSGQLPAQYGYHSTADLENVTGALVNAFNGAYYAALPHSFAETQSQPVAISGHPGWEIAFQQTYTSPQPGMAWNNEAGAVVVADPGNGAAPAVFYVTVPGNLNEANVAALTSSLQLAAPATAPSATPPPQPGGDGNGDG